MLVLVSDTSVLVDLERGGLFDLTFRLPYEFVVPDLLFNRELKGYGGEDLVARGLRVAELDASEVQLAQGTRLDLPVLSLPDAFAYVLAERRGCPRQVTRSACLTPRHRSRQRTAAPRSGSAPPPAAPDA